MAELKMQNLWSTAKELGIPFKIGMKKEELVKLIEAKQAEEQPKKITRAERKEAHEQYMNELKNDTEVLNVLESTESKSAKIRFLLDEGLEKSVIAELLDVRYQMVYSVGIRYEEAKLKEQNKEEAPVE